VPKARNAPLWLKLMVGFHVVAITSWSMPKASNAVKNGVAKPPFWDAEWILSFNDLYLKDSPIRQYLFTTGAWQSWDMFAPNPADVDIWADALVYYRDGSTGRYQYPRMKILPIPEKYIRERYRKFYERVNSDSNDFLWPAFAQRVALLSFKDPANPPERVVLRRHWKEIPRTISTSRYFSDLFSGKKPLAEALLPANPPVTEQYKTSAYYEYWVDQAALKQAAKR